MMALLRRDFIILFRDPRSWVTGAIFFLLFLSFIAIALDGDKQRLQEMAAPGVWLAAIFSLLLTFENLFQADMRNGTLEQFRLAAIPSLSIVASKFFSTFIICILPLVFMTPVIGILYQMSFEAVGPIMLSLLLGAPALMALALVSAAILSGQRSGGFLIILLTLPFMVPVLIFALAGIESYPENGLWNTGFQALSGLSLISMAIGLPAAAAALKASME